MEIVALRKAKTVEKLVKIPIINLIDNGDFSRGFESWMVVPNGDGNIIELTDDSYIGANAVYLYRKTGFGQGYIRQQHEVTIGHKLYFSVFAKGTGAKVRLGDSVSALKYVDFAVDSPEYEQYSIVIEPSDTELFVTVMMWGNEREIYADGLALVDLTSTFGAGYEPAKEACDRLFGDWPYGTQKPLITPKEVFAYFHKEITDIKTALAAIGGY